MTLDELADQERELETAKHGFLKSQGWTYECSNPASLWLWVKTIDGKRFTCTTELALRFEERL